MTLLDRDASYLCDLISFSAYRLLATAPPCSVLTLLSFSHAPLQFLKEVLAPLPEITARLAPTDSVPAYGSPPQRGPLQRP